MSKGNFKKYKVVNLCPFNYLVFVNSFQSKWFSKKHVISWIWKSLFYLDLFFIWKVAN